MKTTPHSKSEFSHLTARFRCNVYGFMQVKRCFDQRIIHVQRRRRRHGRR